VTDRSRPGLEAEEGLLGGGNESMKTTRKKDAAPAGGESAGVESVNRGGKGDQ